MEKSELSSGTIGIITFIVVFVVKFSSSFILESVKEKRANEHTPTKDELVIIDTCYTKHLNEKVFHLTLVDPKTGVMYVETDNSIEELLDDKGKAIIYEGDLEELRIQKDKND